MSSGLDSSGVSIPNDARKMIDDIKEITGKLHTDEEVYAVLNECSMDPNETAQKLLYLDTFHEVKRRRDRKKENVNSRVPEDSRSASGMQKHRALGGRDAVGRRSVGARRENGVNHSTRRSSMPSLLISQKMKNTATLHVAKTSTVIGNGPASVSNGSSTPGRAPQASASGVINAHKEDSALDVKELASVPSLPAIDATQPPSSVSAPTFSSVIRAEKGKSPPNTNFLPSSTSVASVSVLDPVLVSSLNSGNPGTVGTIEHEVGSQQIATEPKHIQVIKNVSCNVDDNESSKSEKGDPSSKSEAVEMNQLSDPSQASSSLSVLSSNCSSQLLQEPDVPSKVIASMVATVPVDTSSPALPESKVYFGQHVTFPSHFHVPGALKNGLTFGSFDANFGLSQNLYIPDGENNSLLAVESSRGSSEPTREPSPSNQSVSSTVQDHSDLPKSPPQVFEDVSPSEISVSSAAVLKNDQLEEETMLAPEGPQNPAVQTAPNYSFGVIPSMLGSHLAQVEGPESQSQDSSYLSNFVSANSPALSAPSSTPATQSTGVVQSSMNVSPLQVPVFRHPYPPNYFPYAQYFPYFLPQIHQFLSHNGIPQQPSTSNIYIPTDAASAGVKLSLPQFKPGTNTGNPAHIGIPFGYSPGPTLTSGSSTGSQDLAASQLKENQIYKTGQLSEGSAVWLPDISNLQLNSLMNIPPQGQHVNFSPAQSGHSAFPGMYQPAQMIPPSTLLPLLHQSQPMAGAAAADSVLPLAAAYQHPQHAQAKWNASY